MISLSVNLITTLLFIIIWCMSQYEVNGSSRLISSRQLQNDNDNKYKPRKNEAECSSRRCCLFRNELHSSDLPNGINCNELTDFECGQNDKYCEWDCGAKTNNDQMRIRTKTNFKRKFRGISSTDGSSQEPSISNYDINDSNDGNDKQGLLQNCLSNGGKFLSIDDCGVEYEEEIENWDVICHQLYDSKDYDEHDKEIRRRLQPKIGHGPDFFDTREDWLKFCWDSAKNGECGTHSTMGCPDCLHTPSPTKSPSKPHSRDANGEPVFWKAKCPSVSTVPGRCASAGGGGRCNKDLVSYAVYCNEANGWCGNTAAHRDAQPSDKYDWQPQSCTYQTPTPRPTKSPTLLGVLGTDGRTKVSNMNVYPYNAVLYMEYDDKLHSHSDCTATMISNTWAITAAHCVWINGKWTSNTWIFLHNINDCNARIEQSKAKKYYLSTGDMWINHAWQQPGGNVHANDWALIRVNTWTNKCTIYGHWL